MLSVLGRVANLLACNHLDEFYALLFVKKPGFPLIHGSILGGSLDFLLV